MTRDYQKPAFQTSNIGDINFGTMLAHKAEEEGIAAVECMRSGHCHVNNEDKVNGPDRILGVHVIGASSKLSFDGRAINSPGLTLSYLRS